MENKKISLILHGHFYQPPRENPFTGIIPKQESAHPYSNWNERILKDCYGSNANSRYLSFDGRVQDITNNFEYISFNFGPTLLSWIEHKNVHIYNSIIEADRQSIRRLGHGNAIAQVFNHTILPLDPRERARHQILWGLEDFRRRFGREAEGIWLAETAINEDVIDLLSQQNVKFVILSPWQCAKVEDENGKMVDLKDKPAPYDRAYILRGKTGGRISAFFYNPDLASGISFGHMLRDADKLYSDLRSIAQRDECDLLHTATDGEIYGHHEPFGDMALAALIHKVRRDDLFEFTNYGAYLADHPAQRRAVLREGEDHRGSSWSCSHGVSRWYKDCGCSTGALPGWNQKWRTPLRIAFNKLYIEVKGLYNSNIYTIFDGKISGDSLLDRYAKVLSREKTMREFISDLHEEFEFSPKDDPNVASMLVGIKNMNFAFTSCGWFFSDINGIEPRQNIAYAVFAAHVFQKYTDKNLLMLLQSELKKAVSNEDPKITGSTIVDEILRQIPGAVEACIDFRLNRLICSPQDYETKYGVFELVRYEKDYMVLMNVETLTCHYANITFTREKLGFRIQITIRNDVNPDYVTYILDNSSLTGKMIDRAYVWLSRAVDLMPEYALASFSKNIEDYSVLANTSTGKLPQLSQGLLQENVAASIKMLRNIFNHNTAEWKAWGTYIVKFLGFVMNYGSVADVQTVTNIFNDVLAAEADYVYHHGLSDNLILNAMELLKLSYSKGLLLELWDMQNAAYAYMTGRKQIEDGVDTELFYSLVGLLNFAQ